MDARVGLGVDHVTQSLVLSGHLNRALDSGRIGPPREGFPSLPTLEAGRPLGSMLVGPKELDREGPAIETFEPK